MPFPTAIAYCQFLLSMAMSWSVVVVVVVVAVVVVVCPPMSLSVQ